MVGWGKTTFDKDAPGTTLVLMELQIPVVGIKECEKEYRRAEADPKRKAPDCKSNVKLVFDEHVFCAGYSRGGKGAVTKPPIYFILIFSEYSSEFTIFASTFCTIFIVKVSWRFRRTSDASGACEW